VLGGKELEAGREHYLRRRGLHYRLDGKRRWSFYCRKKLGYVWQRGRFNGDSDFWASCISDPASVQPVKAGKALRFKLQTNDDFRTFQDAATAGLKDHEWIESVRDEAFDDNDERE